MESTRCCAMEGKNKQLAGCLEGFILDESATRSFIVSVMEDLKYFWSSIFM